MERIEFSLAWKTPLSPGAQSDLVWLVQAMLTALSHHFVNLPQPAFTGIYDRSTQEAITRIQRACGLPANGIIDTKTFDHLCKMFCAWQ